MMALIPCVASAQLMHKDSVFEEKNDVYSYVEQMPEFPGGQAELMKFLQQNLDYPSDARAAGAEGKVVAQFVVNEDGSISSIKIIRSVFPSCDSEVVAILSRMPKWTPGMQNGSVVKVYFMLPVTFKLNEEDYTKPNITLPYYAEGGDSLRTFIQKNIQYPKAAKKNRVEGTVVLSFDVDSIGQAKNIKIYKGIGSGCDEEAIRILKLISHWIPGTRDGKNVTMPFYMNVDFKPAAKK